MVKKRMADMDELIQSKISQIREELKGSLGEKIKKINPIFSENPILESLGSTIFSEYLLTFALINMDHEKLKGSYLESLIPEKSHELYPEMLRFATEKLAGILSGCIEWNEKGSRNDTDWFSAEEYIKSRNGDQIQKLGERYILLSTYDALRQENLKKLPPISRHSINLFMPESIVESIIIKSVLKDSPEEKVRDLVQRVVEGNTPNNKYLFLGRSIWNNLYQSMKSNFDFKAKGYGNIKFD